MRFCGLYYFEVQLSKAEKQFHWCFNEAEFPNFTIFYRHTPKPKQFFIYVALSNKWRWHKVIYIG